MDATTNSNANTYLTDEAIDDELNVRMQILPLCLGRRAHYLNAFLHNVVAILVLDALHHLVNQMCVTCPSAY